MGGRLGSGSFGGRPAVSLEVRQKRPNFGRVSLGTPLYPDPPLPGLARVPLFLSRWRPKANDAKSFPLRSTTMPKRMIPNPSKHNPTNLPTEISMPMCPQTHQPEEGSESVFFIYTSSCHSSPSFSLLFPPFPPFFLLFSSFSPLFWRATIVISNFAYVEN